MPKFRSLAVATLTAALLVPAAAEAAPKGKGQGSKQQQCKKGQKGKNCQPTVSQGRMTGHGHQFNVNGFDKVQWEFRNSVCNQNRFPDLKIEFGRNKFILTSYSSPLQCIDTELSEGRPLAGFDTIDGQGGGTLNGVKGATIEFRFADAGGPGRNDTASFTIMSPGGKVAYSGGAIDGGNHQAHRK